MSSILRPSPADMTRRIIVMATAVFAILVPQVQMGLGWGQSAAEFAADSDATLRVIGWAFAIWGVIYLGLAAYAIRQVLPQTGESDVLKVFGWPSALAFVGIGLWIIAAAFDWEVATIVLIFASLTVLLIPLLAHAGRIRALRLGDRDRWLTVWPMSLLAGWLTVAAPVNLITVATGNGDLPAMASPTVWAVLAVVLVGLVAVAVSWRIRTIAYSLPIVWGLIGVFVAEQSRNGTLAFTAAIVAVATLVASVVVVLAWRRRIERV
ncbi:hypothetical protein [Brevundimonas sp.]|uniref:hypothetical protein n=1 Tax=Brevundimonas sp. TaxID=1871086 RepID=UPI001A1FAC1A|nr:hypothetical protein [Brevundimonas sp.]MBJ7486101.1 hypothetical protein [Brevundimonas sp.]